jgi:hypothetical protein
MPQSAVTLRVVRVDATVSRVAELVTPPQATVRLVDHPRGTTTLTLQARNVGANPWRVGGTDVLGVTSPPALHCVRRVGSPRRGLPGSARVQAARRPRPSG